MVDINKILSSLSSSSTAKGALGGFAGGALASSLMSKKGRKNAKTLLKVGGVAAVGTLAWKAYQNYQSKNSQTANVQTDNVQTGNVQTGNAQINNAQVQPPPMQPQASPLPIAQANNWNQLEEQVFELKNDTSDSQSLLILKSMVAAAMSDGHIDGKEFQNISLKADELGVSGDEKNIIFNEIQNPMNLQTVISQASSPELALEVYTASLLAIDESTPQAQQYLSQLSNGLQLPLGLVQAVHSQVQSTMS